ISGPQRSPTSCASRRTPSERTSVTSTASSTPTPATRRWSARESWGCWRALAELDRGSRSTSARRPASQQCNGVAAPRLGGVERSICRALGVRPAPPHWRHADADRHSVGEECELHALSDPLSDRQRVELRAITKQRRELVAADPRDEITGPQLVGGRPRDLRQDSIARGVPADVVDLLEIVDVDREQEAALVPLQDAIEGSVERAAIRQTGQRILVGEELVLRGAEGLLAREAAEIARNRGKALGRGSRAVRPELPGCLDRWRARLELRGRGPLAQQCLN